MYPSHIFFVNVISAKKFPAFLVFQTKKQVYPEAHASPGTPVFILLYFSSVAGPSLCRLSLRLDRYAKGSPSGRAGSANALTERAISTRRCRAAGPSGRRPAPAGKWAVRAHRRCSYRNGSPAPAPAGRSSGRRPSPFPA